MRREIQTSPGAGRLDQDAVRARSHPIADGRLVFLCGLHRSGTSILHRALGSHFDVSTFRNTGVPEDEGQFLQTVFNPARAHGGPGRFGFDERAHLTEESSLVTDANRAKLLFEWGSHWDADKTVWIEKSPPNLIRTRFLQALFPNSAFIVILRHPIAVSYATQKWVFLPVHRLIHHWVHCHERFRSDAKHLRRLRILHYEDFVARPDATLESIHEFLGLAPAPKRIEIHSDLNQKYLARWSRRWLRPRRRYLEWIEQRFGERVREFGYSLASPGDRRPFQL